MTTDPHNSTKIAAIYARVSTPDQKKNKSLENQIEKCRQYAQSQGFAVSPEYEYYDVFTGTKLQRPAFDRVKEMVGKFDAVIFHVVDRFSRHSDVLDSVQQIRWFEENGVHVHIANRGRIDTKDEMSLIILILELSAAAKERESIVRRTSDGRFDRVQKSGKMCMGSKAYYGYDYSKTTGKLTINPNEAVWAEKIFYWHAVERLGAIAICNRLRELNVPTKHDNMGRSKSRERCVWAVGTLTKMWTATVYKGFWTYKDKRDGGKTATVESPAIVSPELWDLCQEVSRSNRKGNNTGRATYPALLARRIICANCGRTFGHRSDWRRKDEHRYICPGQVAAYSIDGKTRCCEGSFNLDTVDAQVWDALANALRNPANIIEGFRADKESKLAESQFDRDHLDRCKIDLAKLDSAIARQRQMFTFDETYSEDEYKRTVANLNYQRQLQLDKITEIENRFAEQTQNEMSIEAFERYCERINEGLDLLTSEDKRYVIEALNVQATIQRGPSVKTRYGSRASGSLSLTAIVPLDIDIELNSDVANLTPAPLDSDTVPSTL